MAKGKSSTSGRRPVPVELKDNSKSKLTKKELQARADAKIKGISSNLVMPEYLTGEAADEYIRIVELYRSANVEVLNDLDLNLLAMRCETWGKWLALNREEKALVKKARNYISYACGREAQFKAMWDSNQYAKEKAQAFILKCDELLCLNPTSRERLGILGAKNKEKENPPTGMAELLNSPKV